MKATLDIGFILIDSARATPAGDKGAFVVPQPFSIQIIHTIREKYLTDCQQP